jgi:hypothetical protein
MRNLKNNFFVFLLFITLSSCESPLLQTIKERPKAPVLSNISINRDDVGSDWAVLKFKSVDNASEYRVYYKTETMDNWVSIPRDKKLPDDNEQEIVWDFISDDNEPEIDNSDSNLLEIKILNLTPDTWYSFYIAAVNDIGRESEKNDDISVYTKLPTPVIKNTEIRNHYTVNIEWFPVSGADYYAIYYSNIPLVPDEPKKWEIKETGYTVNTLEEDTIFYFWVQAYSVYPDSPFWLNRKNDSGLIRINRRTQLSTPDLSIDEDLTTSSSIYMHWAAVSGANSYEIQYSAYSSESPNERSWSQETVNVTTCVIAELEPNTLYVFKIRALNSSGNNIINNSIFSEETRAYRTRMEPPSVLAKEVTPEKIVLEWTNKNSYDNAPYTFKYGTSPSAYSPSITTNRNSYDFNSLSENTRYYFSISARDLSGYDGKEEEFSCFTLLYKPENLAVETVSEDTVALSWDEKSGADGYIVEVYDSSSSLIRKTQLGNIIHNTSYSVEGLAPNTRYSFAVRAVKEDAIGVNPANHVEGEPSGMVSALTLLSVPQPVIARQLARSIELFWQPAAGTDFYKVFYSTSDSFETAVQYNPEQPVTGVSCTVQGLDTGTDYYFWVQAFNNSGNYSRLSPSIKGSTITSNINIIFDFSDPSEFDPVLEGMPENIIQTSRDSYTITVKTGEAGWNKTEWYLYGVIERHTVGNSFTIDWQLPVGPYELTVVVTKNNIPYSASVQFKVLNTEGY